MEDIGFKILAITVPILCALVFYYIKMASAAKDSRVMDSLGRLEDSSQKTVNRLDDIGSWMQETKTYLAVRETQCAQHENSIGSNTTAIQRLTEGMGVVNSTLQTYHDRLSGADVVNYRNSKLTEENKK